MHRILFVASSHQIGEDEIPALTLPMAAALSRNGFACEVLCGAAGESIRGVDAIPWLADRGHEFDAVDGTVTARPEGIRVDVPPHLIGVADGVPMTIYLGTAATPHEPDDAERDEFLRLLDVVLKNQKGDIQLYRKVECPLSGPSIRNEME